MRAKPMRRRDQLAGSAKYGVVINWPDWQNTAS